MTAPHKQVWTSPGEDPQLVGNETRTAWLMTRDNVGADLLSGGEGGGEGQQLSDWRIRTCQGDVAYLWLQGSCPRCSTSLIHSPPPC